MVNDEEIRKVLAAPGVVALIMASLRFMLTGNKESPWRVIAYLVGAGYLAYLAGPYMEAQGYTAEEIALAAAAIGFVIPNLLMGLIELTKRFKDDPAGLLIDILSRFRRK